MDQRARIGGSVWILRIMIGLLPLLWVPVSQGQTTSITSSGLNTQVSHGAGQQNYDITGGTRPGGGPNLFHSFGDFSVGTSQVARFLNDSGLATTNILSRVTGGHVSNIFGEINTTSFPGANLYLINPAGVLFGPTATLNVSGSVHVSTADYLRLADGLRFHAVPGPQDALLSQAPVVAFGFLNPHPRPISVNGATLAVNSGQKLSLIGGDVKVSGGTLNAPKQINLVSVASRGEVQIGPSGEPIVSGVGRLGRVTLADHAVVQAGGTGNTTGGTVVLRAGKLVIDHAKIDASGAEGGGQISIEARDSAMIRNSPVALDVRGTNAQGLPAPGGAITIDAGRIQLTKSGLHATGTEGGTVRLNAQGTVAMDDSRIDTGATVLGGAVAPGDHQAGTIRINAGDSVHLLNRTVLAADTLAGDGKAGTIVIDTGKSVVSDASTFSAKVGGVGDINTGGTVAIHAKGLVRLDGSRIDTGAESGSVQQAGNIDIQAGGSMQLLNGTVLTAVGLGASGLGGTVTLHADHAVLMEGSRVDTSGLGSSSFGPASPGNILIKASDSVRLLKDSALTADGIGIGSVSRGGQIVVDAGRNILVDQSHLSTRNEAFGVGSPGEVKLMAGDSVRLLHGASISADVILEPRQAGNVTITARGNVLMDASQISAGIWGPGQIGITAGQSVRVLNGSQLSVSGSDGGRAGTLTIQAGTTFVGQDSSFLAHYAPPGTAGSGGTIHITAPDQVRLTNSLVDTSMARNVSADSVGGAIAITSGAVRLHNSRLLSTGSEGTGGTITIKTDAFRRDAASVLDVSGETANGTVKIEPLP